MVAPWLAPAVIAGGSIAGSLLGGKRQKVKFEEPAEISRARQALERFYQTGQFGDFKAGDYRAPIASAFSTTPYTGSLGDFDPTDIEQSGLGRLRSFVSSGRPEIFGVGEGALRDILTAKDNFGERFDPYSAKGEFTPFKEALEKELGEGSNRIRRQAAFGGNLFSGATTKRLGELEQEGQRQLSGRLASEYDKFVTRKMGRESEQLRAKLSAIPLAFEGAQRGQALDFAPAEAAFRYGGLERGLRTQGAQARLGEFLRQHEQDYPEFLRRAGEERQNYDIGRRERQLPIEAARTILGGPQPPTEFNLPGQNPFGPLLNRFGEASIDELIRQMFSRRS